nr:proline and serine-rich protein 2 [Pelodiscus sinensis]XP_025037447.1 proline and serine-rich protein 2 [Pelodiscus sinensis]XP_025037448.1 proline and serine-rich protein 2 [Pelodiscus sinensis]|eukprot:XP_025037446.1 proline and serine-rich protein 2 [Pelodiscus sinensis]
MPRNVMLDFTEMASEVSPKCRLESFERSGSLESRGSHSRCRNFTLDDESLQYLTHEEKDVLLFLEETIDAFEDDLEEQVLHDSGIHCHSPRSMEENASSHSESEDIIDLVQATPESSDPECTANREIAAVSEPAGRVDDPKPEGSELPEKSLSPDAPTTHASATPLTSNEQVLAPCQLQHPSLHRSIPTPFVLAQKVSENQNTTRTCSSPKHPPLPATKSYRFPSNINITNAAGKDFSRTISKAAVNVQERKAQVLASMNGAAFETAETEERVQKNEFLTRSRSSSLRDLTSEQIRYEALTKLGLVKEKPRLIQQYPAPNTQKIQDLQAEQEEAVPNGYQNIHTLLKCNPSPFLPMGKTVMIKPDMAISSDKVVWQNVAKSFSDHGQSTLNLEMRKRSCSLPRPSGFRSQGITVQFSGRGSTEEARKEALRKLGLLKETM